MTTIAGRYEIDSEIGRGGMGVVYLAVDQTIGRKVALKKLAIDSHDSQSGDAVKRFMREAQLTGQLHHPDIVTLFDLVEEDGDLYLVSSTTHRVRWPMCWPMTVRLLKNGRAKSVRR